MAREGRDPWRDEDDAPRPSSSQPDYGGRHRRLRERWTPVVATGRVRCGRGPQCKHAEIVEDRLVGGYIAAGAPWDLGHHDLDSSLYTGPEHAECNRATKGRGGSRSRPQEPHPGSI